APWAWSFAATRIARGSRFSTRAMSLDIALMSRRRTRSIHSSTEPWGPGAGDGGGGTGSGAARTWAASLSFTLRLLGVGRRARPNTGNRQPFAGAGRKTLRCGAPPHPLPVGDFPHE